MAHKKKKKEKRKTIINRILGIFTSSPQKSYNYKQLANVLNLKDPQKKKGICHILNLLVSSGTLEEIKRGTYKLKSRTGIIEGTIQMTNRGFAFVKSKNIPEKIKILKSNLNKALDGDKVRILIYSKHRHANLYGEVQSILKRSERLYYGTIEQTGIFYYLHPENKKMPYKIFIPPACLHGAKNGKKVLVKIIGWPDSSILPVGEVVEIISPDKNYLQSYHSIIAEFNLPFRFPENVEKAAEKIKLNISKEEYIQRRDFREIPSFTIDPEDARDFDDAISVQKINNKLFQIGIHIADVSHYVKPNTIIDREAQKRATSVYLVDKVIPMLPEQLSNNICSLKPDEDRLCFSIVFDIDDKAKIHKQWIGKTIIRSNKRFTYAEAQKIIETAKGEFAEELSILHKLATILRKQRFDNGAFALETSEIHFKLANNGKPIEIFIEEYNEANKLIEEFMLLANKKVAEFIGKEKAKTFIYRIHDKPNLEKIKDFAFLIKRFGYNIKYDTEKNLKMSLNRLLDQIKGTNVQDIIETLAVRTMAKARYATQNIGHYGLQFNYYTHFTSPIRRYPDIIAHRLLWHYLQSSRSVHIKKYDKLCEHASFMEQLAEEAERASIKTKQIEFLSKHIGETFKAIISNVTKWGLYVEIIENKCEGLVHIRELDDDLYFFDAKNLCIKGKYSNNIYHSGDEVNVKVINTNLIERQVDMKIV